VTARPPSLAAVIAYLAIGEGGLAVAELRALGAGPAPPLTALEMHYWLGLAHLLAFDWSAAAHELRAYLAQAAQTPQAAQAAQTTLPAQPGPAAHGGADWRAGWAYLHLGRAYERAGRIDEASLAYRGCLAVEGAERPARRLAFDLMSRLAASLPMGYGQASSREATD
jgi:hypothetical protein